MADKGVARIPIFEAPPLSERRTVVIRDEQRISRPNLIPDDLMKDEFLNSLIESSLPKNYNFEVPKTIWKIKQTEAKTVLLQLPEGLIRFGTVLVDIMTSYFSENGRPDEVKFITMGDLTYGACCIDDYLASSMGCDLIIHYAHSCLVPINQLDNKVKYLYVFLDIKFDMEHVQKSISHNFDPKKHHICLASTIQFVSSTHELAGYLRQSGFSIVVPQSKPLSPGEVLGCTAPKLSADVNTIVFICDGRFHLEALMIANPTVDSYRYDPYSRKLTRESYAFDEMYKQRYSAIARAVEVMKSGGTFGFVLGTLGRQGSQKVFDRLSERLKSHTNCKLVKVMMPEVVQESLDKFTGVDVWVQVACPRLSIDWGSFFRAPLLNPYEFAQSIKQLTGANGDQAVDKRYPMDFYAKNSCGDHTPNHGCLGNENCECKT